MKRAHLTVKHLMNYYIILHTHKNMWLSEVTIISPSPADKRSLV